jgi:hypothetical protein
MHKESFIINCNTLLHNFHLLRRNMSGKSRVKSWISKYSAFVGCFFHTPTCFDPAGSFSGRTFSLSLELERAVDCVMRCFWRRELSLVPACIAVEAGQSMPWPRTVQNTSQRRKKAKAHSHLTVQVHPTVQQTVPPEDYPAGSKHVGGFYE